MSLYRIAYVSASQARSVLRELELQPVPGDRLTLDAHTVVTVREVIAQADDGGTITAEVIAETDEAPADPS